MSLPEGVSQGLSPYLTSGAATTIQAAGQSHCQPNAGSPSSVSRNTAWRHGACAACLFQTLLMTRYPSRYGSTSQSSQV